MPGSRVCELKHQNLCFQSDQGGRTAWSGLLLYISGWGADYGDPANFIDQERYGYGGAYYSNNYSRINNATDEDLIATYKEFSLWQRQQVLSMMNLTSVMMHM